jgi:hypothetical protein
VNLVGAQLIEPLNAPRGVRGTPGLQPSGPPIFIGRYVIVFGTNGGVFLYSGTPGLGNPPILWDTLGTADPYGNPVTPGVFIAELIGSGNAKGGLMWNTVVGSQPLLALFPDSTVGFTGHSPFILGQVFNRGLVNEYLSLALGGGAGTGVSSPVLMNLFSISADSTLNPHISFYAGASANLVCDISSSYLNAANPASPGVIETWHTATITGTGYTAGSPAPAYKLYADNTAALTGSVNVASGSGGAVFLTLPSQYRPVTAKKFPAAFSAGTPVASGNAQVTVNTSGAVQFSAVPTGSAFTFALDGMRFALDY